MDLDVRTHLYRYVQYHPQHLSLNIFYIKIKRIIYHHQAPTNLNIIYFYINNTALFIQQQNNMIQISMYNKIDK